MRYLVALLVFQLPLTAALAAPVEIGAGKTSVVLDFDALASLASLELSGVSGDVVGGSLPDSVAFPINSRNATPPLLSTTFSYDPADFLGSFNGTIEHVGSVFFNADSVEVGNFTIAFDAARAGTLGGNASGFYVQSTVGLPALLFDVAAPSLLLAEPGSLTIQANLLVSPEFGDFLFTQGLSQIDLTGAVIGTALVEAIPEPSTFVLGLIGAAAAIVMAGRRRQSNRC